MRTIALFALLSVIAAAPTKRCPAPANDAAGSVVPSDSPSGIANLVAADPSSLEVQTGGPTGSARPTGFEHSAGSNGTHRWSGHHHHHSGSGSMTFGRSQPANTAGGGPPTGTGVATDGPMPTGGMGGDSSAGDGTGDDTATGDGGDSSDSDGETASTADTASTVSAIGIATNSQAAADPTGAANLIAGAPSNSAGATGTHSWGGGQHLHQSGSAMGNPSILPDTAVNSGSPAPTTVVSDAPAPTTDAGGPLTMTTQITTTQLGSPTSSLAPVGTEPVTLGGNDKPPTTTSAAPVTSNTSVSAGGAGGSGGGAGLAVNGNSGDLTSFQGSGSTLGWYYDWGLNTLPNAGSLEFVPQVWGSGNVAGVKAAAANWPAGTKYVLGFNEPDMTSSVGGSGIDAATAATQHQAWVSALGGSYSIGSPAVARGSKKWMDDWVTACAGACKYDFVPFHFYGTNADDLITYAKDFYATYKKPLWLTEWSCIDYSSGQTCTDAQVKTFMSTAITWFKGDGKSIVERWSYFGAFKDMAAGGNPNGLEGADGTANAMGKYYVSL